jgi:hypothetical protein
MQEQNEEARKNAGRKCEILENPPTHTADDLPLMHSEIACHFTYTYLLITAHIV